MPWFENISIIVIFVEFSFKEIKKVDNDINIINKPFYNQLINVVVN